MGNDLKFYYGVYIKVHVVTESKKEVVAEKDDLIYVSVREKAEQGLANRRVLELLRVKFGVKANVRIVSGHHSPHKIISVE
ncbi:MAG: DUF167 domain-containing protein [bacterium]|nr:DUF167 domain-containing protein [bacterium]